MKDALNNHTEQQRSRRSNMTDALLTTVSYILIS